MFGFFSLGGTSSIQLPDQLERKAYFFGKSQNHFVCGEEKPIKTSQGWVLCLGTLVSIDGKLNTLSSEDFSHTVFNLYRRDGESFYKRFDGLHLLLLFDSEKDKLLICNNSYQSGKCYYSKTDRGLIFSTHLTQIVKLSGQSFEIHKPSVFSFLSNGFTSSEETQLVGVKKLNPTFALEVSGKGHRIINHWENEIQFDRKPFSNLQAELDRYEEIYRSGIANFFEVKKPHEVGCLLSGGHDTSFAMIQSSKVHHRPIHGLTCTFPGWAFDEDLYAKNICKKSGGTYHPIPVTPDSIDHLVSLIRSNEEPVVGSSLPLHILSRYAKEHVDVMLGGDGGDTLWGEYFPVAEFHRYVSLLPLGLRKLVHKTSQKLVQWTDWERFWELEHVASLFAEENFYDDFLRKLCTYRHFRESYINELFSDDFLKEGITFSKSQVTVPFNKNNFSDALIEGKLLNGFYPYQSFHTTKSMAEFGMELYLPTIQRDIIRFITNLPMKWVNGGSTFHRLINSKSINRKFHKLALGRYLKKEEIYNRSFDIPWYNILRPRKRVLELLKKRLLARGWFDGKALNDLFDEFMGQSVKDYELLELKHHGYRIFTLLSLEIWCTEYLDMRLTENYHSEISLEEYLEL